MTMRHPHPTWLAAVLLLSSGCGETTSSPSYEASTTTAPAQAAGELKQLGLATHEAAGFGPAGGEKTAAKASAPTPASQRKIIYNAQIELTVEDFARAERALSRLVRQYDGYVANSNLQGSPGSQRSGTWEARIPAEKLEGFVDDVVRLGELQSQKLSSQDVSRQFFDTEARIKNKKAEEQRLVKLLEEAVGKLEEVLKVEEQLTRVREEIELMQGQLNQWSSLVALSTVTVTIHERKPFAPPAPAAPTFGTRVARTFQGSLGQLVEFGEGLVLLVVAVAPWLPVILLALVVILWFVRRILFRSHPGPGRRADVV